MALPKGVAESFARQAAACDALGSPFTARICRLLAERLDPASEFGRRITAWPGSPGEDALALRAAGGLNALARSGRCAALTVAYPPNMVDDTALWAALREAIAAHDSFLAGYLDSPPQTNEVARSNAILGGCLCVAAATGKPLEVLEIGSSAGLNLAFDRYRYDLGGGRAWGAPDAAVRIAARWEGDPPPLDAPLMVARRAGCDLAPLDPAAPRDRERLLSYVWPDQSERIARTVAALGLAAEDARHVERADAASWIEARLGEPAPTGHARVIFHTIVWQYLPRATRERIEAAIGAAGRAATVDTPLAWLTVEADGRTDSAAIGLTLWPSGAGIRLGRADFHGRWTRWEMAEGPATPPARPAP